MMYRLEELDTVIRRQRTVHEAGLISSAKRAGIGAPFVYFVSQPRTTIIMEYVRGERMRDLVAGLGAREASVLFRKMGSAAAKLHSAGIMHGDLTTANVIVRDGGLVFVDFGLSVHSTRVEDHAVDLRLIKETITGAHAAIAGPATDALLEGYAEVAGERRAAAVRRQLREIERRGRYARVE